MTSPTKTGSHNINGAASEMPPDELLFGSTPAMTIMRKRAEKICKANLPLLLCGPVGSGKEMIARWVHNHSANRDGQFVQVSCAAIPESLLESELFGYEKGAFTGAYASKPGRVELAHNGTLFLDEIADLHLGLQSKLLHFLQDGLFSRIGDSAERRVETRLICSTNRNLEQAIEAQRFRADLFYRISVVQLKLLSLAERRQDIPSLAEYLRTTFEKKFAKKSQPLAGEMLEYLDGRDWPGNVRELANEIARHVLLGPSAAAMLREPQERAVIANKGRPREGAVTLKHIARDAVRETERRVILQALRNNRWNRRKAAQALRISYRTLIYKIRDAGIGPDRETRDTLNPATTGTTEGKSITPRPD